ncbi:MAG TPA: hypothetical protein VLU54_08530 [Casimicrobiaceae bacterium]|nr:hypothetical protein [Casimicrobiaceae bacterium]
MNIAGAITLLFPALALAAPQVPPSAPVTVVNTSANPVPVSGNVGIAGTPNVNVVSMPQVTLDPASTISVKTQDAASLFTVPFFIEQASGPPTKSSLRGDFTLPQPAILESISIKCGGYATGGLLSLDGGPLGTNGVTGVGANPDVGLVVGLLAGQQAEFHLPVVTPPGGGSYLPVTHIGAPVQSSFSFILFQDTSTSGASCFVNAIFRSLG